MRKLLEPYSMSYRSKGVTILGRNFEDNFRVLKRKEDILDFIKIYEEKFHRCILFKDFLKLGLELLSNHHKI